MTDTAATTEPHPFQPDDLYPERCGYRDERFVICGWAKHIGFHVPVVAAQTTGGRHD